MPDMRPSVSKRLGPFGSELCCNLPSASQRVGHEGGLRPSTKGFQRKFETSLQGQCRVHLYGPANPYQSGQAFSLIATVCSNPTTHTSVEHVCNEFEC